MFSLEFSSLILGPVVFVRTSKNSLAAAISSVQHILSLCSTSCDFLTECSTFRSSQHRCCIKKVFLEISHNSQENTCARVSFLIKLACNFIKKDSLTQVFSCEFCEISKNTFFYGTALDDCF